LLISADDRRAAFHRGTCGSTRKGEHQSSKSEVRRTQTRKGVFHREEHEAHEERHRALTANRWNIARPGDCVWGGVRICLCTAAACVEGQNPLEPFFAVKHPKIGGFDIRIDAISAKFYNSGRSQICLLHLSLHGAICPNNTVRPLEHHSRMKTQCPNCSQRVEVDDEWAGCLAACPTCEAEFTIPNRTIPPP
jgi:hypothetical protein